MYRTAAVLAAVGIGLAGCAGIGDKSTTCEEFNGMSQDSRSATIANVLKARNGRNGSTSDVQSLTRRTVAFCGSNANQDKMIDEAG